MIEYIKAKTIITKTKTTDWFGLDYNMNIYKGCCHGCIYCDSRSECYQIKDFDRVRGKENALEIIRNDLRRKVKKGVIGMGGMSDPYNPFEKELFLTRHALELIDAYEFGVSIATKSALLTRDVDLLQSIKEHSPVLAKVTITTSNDALAKLIEPGAATSSERFKILKVLGEAGIFSGILLMPVLPFLEDSEENILDIVRQASECKVKFIYPGMGVTLRTNQRAYYFQKLTELFPDKKLVDLYRKQYGNNYMCRSPNSKKLYELLKTECAKYGILTDMKAIKYAYKKDYGERQLSLFDL